MAKRLSRRALLRLAGVGTVAGAAAWALRDSDRFVPGAAVFVGRAERYDEDMADVMVRGLRELGVRPREIRGRRVLLKPNLVETDREAPHINTHPTVVVSAAEAFRRLGAAEVFVAEGQGHRRDSRLVLDESGMAEALSAARLRFVDLNHDDIEPAPNRGTQTPLRTLYLPKTLASADLVVSVAKLKTHHWAAMTGAMKNLFGVMPGVVYGWPKNVLHHVGIHGAIVDIATTIRPHFAIVDGVVGMEGDGPIMGTPRQLGCLVMGRNATSVDATCARLIGLAPSRIPYLAASGELGPIDASRIEQRGETLGAHQTRFDLVDVPHLRGVRLGGA